MSDPLLNEPHTLLLGLGFLTTGFMGSWHCALMCGPLACLNLNNAQLFQYHLGRITSYTLLGAASGALGHVLFNSQYLWLRNISFALLVFLALATALKMAMPSLASKMKTPDFFGPSIFRIFKTQLSRPGFFLGLASCLLPCGWLYSFVVGAAATGSMITGALIMFLFALTAIPALSLFPKLIGQSLQKSGIKQRNISYVVLTISSVYALVAHFF